MSLRERISAERGVAAVEFAIVSLLLMLLLYGTLQYGFIFAVQHNMTQAASEGARAASRAPAGSEETFAADRARASLTFDRVESDAVVDAVIVDPCEPTTPTIRCIRVTITYPYGADPIVPAILNIGIPSTMTGEAILQLDPS